MCMLFSLRNYCAFQLKFYVRTRHIHLASIMSGKENTRKRKGNEEGPVSKKMKVKVEDDAEAGPSSQNSAGVKFTDTSKDFLELINHAREAKAQSVSAFKFNKKRVRMLSTAKEFPEECDGVIYWMSRDQRVQDNWAMLYAQRLALKMEVPLHVVFCLVPKFLEATMRQYGFMLKGLQEVEQECGRLGITFHLLTGYAKEVLPDFVKCNNIGGVVTDFSPLRVPKQWVKDVTENLPKNIPLCQVDAHNIVPCWEASDKREYGARTIRNKIQSKLPEYLTEFPPVIRHPYAAKTKAEPVDWSAAKASLQIDRTVTEVKWASPGTTAGLRTLETFCKERLKFFNADRNNPNKNACSNLSPWIHFGQVSAQRCALVVKQFKSKFKEGGDAFLEESIIRRELSDNFCYYVENYDSIECAYVWAKETLRKHASDKREYVYTCKQLEEGKTHDDLWNAAQLQMVKEGKMHGFLRMYWAKKILEWTSSPEEALKISIYLNDRYELDGRDPNGYVGCMWSICGIHDQGWGERPVFGKIRFMNYQGCKRKFDVPAFVRKYEGKKH